MSLQVPDRPLRHGRLACAAHDAELICVSEGDQVILAERCPSLGIRQRQPGVATTQVIAAFGLW